MLEAVDTRVDACRSALDAEIQSRASLQQLQSVQEEVDRRVAMLQVQSVQSIPL